MKLTYNDRQHAYWLDGRRCKGVTTVASIPDNRFNIERWNKRMVAVGMALNPPLVQRAQAHFDERDQLDDIAEEALTAAKAHEASGRGTAIHRETERADLGLDWVDTPETRAIRQAWTDALTSTGLEVIPELVERIVVYPDQMIAGRFDRICRRTSDGALVVVDVKTGENAIRYPHSTVCQLAMYANGPLLAGPLTRSGKNEVTTEFGPMPDVDKTTAYVVYLPADGTPGQVHELDIAAGWHTVTNICFPVLEWRARNQLTRQIPAVAPAMPTDGPVAGTPDIRPSGVPAANQTPPAAQIQWLWTRVKWLIDNGYGEALAAEWNRNPHIPTFGNGGPRTVQHVTALDEMCDRVEDANEAPFGPSDPTQPATTKATRRTA